MFNNPPQNPHAVTPAWLTAVLRQNKFLHHVQITSLSIETIGDEEGFSGSIARYKLIYDRHEAAAPQTIIGKFALEEPALRQLLSTEYQNEALFYAQLADLIKIKTPTCFYHHFDLQTGALLLLLEDLTHWQLPNLIAGVSANEAHSVGKLLVTILATILFDNSSAQRRAWRQADLQRNIAFIDDHQLLTLL